MRVMSDYAWAPALMLGFAAACSFGVQPDGAGAEQPGTPFEAPYTMTSGVPLVIAKNADAPAGTLMFLEHRDALRHGRTAATRAGVDFRCTTPVGVPDGYTGLVWRSGDGPTYRAAIERPADRLGAPAIYDGMPWAWADIPVVDGPIKPGPHTVGGDCE